MPEITGPCIIVFEFPTMPAYVKHGDDGRFIWTEDRSAAYVFDDEHEAAKVLVAYFQENARSYATAQAVEVEE